MKTLLTLIAVICLIGAALGQQPGQPPKPAPEQKALEVWIGDWQYEGQAQDSPIGPGGRFAGTQTVRWVLDGFFVEFRSKEKGNLGDLEQVELDWYDPAAKNYPFQGYLNLGDRYSAVGTVSGNIWRTSGTWTHKGTEYKFRTVITFAADGMSNTWKTEISPDGKTWAFWNEGKATKTARATAAAAPEMTNISTAGKTTEAASASAQAEQELINLENGWTEAAVKRDLAFLDRILADELTATDPDGTVMTKAQNLALIRSGEYAATSATQDAIKVRVYGDVAVVTGRCTEKSQFKGKDSSGRYQWTDTLIRRDGRWQCVATHSTKIAEK